MKVKVTREQFLNACGIPLNGADGAIFRVPDDFVIFDIETEQIEEDESDRKDPK